MWAGCCKSAELRYSLEVMSSRWFRGQWLEFFRLSSFFILWRILLKELGLGSLERSVLRSTTPSSSVSDKLLAEKKKLRFDMQNNSYFIYSFIYFKGISVIFLRILFNFITIFNFYENIKREIVNSNHSFSYLLHEIIISNEFS